MRGFMSCGLRVWGLGHYGLMPTLQESELYRLTVTQSAARLKAATQGTAFGVGIRGTLGDIDPLNQVPFKRGRRRVKKGAL